MKQVAGVVAVDPSSWGASVLGAVTDDTPTTRVHLCRHCLKVLEGKIKATYNGAPLCVDNDPSCYKLVSQFHHEMPCLGDPCPGAVGMEHDHSEDVS